MAEEKKNVFEELGLSVWNFKSYGMFLKNRGGRVFGFSALLIGLYLLLNTMLMSVQTLGFINSFKSEVLTRLPEFVLEDGKLTMDETFEMDEPGFYVYINTDDYLTEDEIRDIFYDYSTAIIMDSEGVAVQSDGEHQMFSYEEIQEALGGNRYTQEDLGVMVQQFMPYVYILMGIMFLFVGIGSIAAFYFRILLVSLIVLIMVKIMHMGLDYGAVFKLSVYTRAIPVLLRLLVGILPFSIPFFWVVDFGISAVYAYMALKAIRDAEPPMMQGGYQQPYNGQGSYQQPYNGQGGYQQPYNGQGNYQQPYNGQGSYQQPGNWQGQDWNR